MYKKLKSYKSYENAQNFYNKKIEESQKIFFETKIQNTKDVKFEIVLTENKNTKQTSLFVTDELGRNIKVKTDDSNFTILKIFEYKISDTIYDIQKKKKINFIEFCEKYLKFKDLKVVSSLNNKIVVQRDDNFSLFSCKDENESHRFLDELSKYMLQNKRSDIMIVFDTSIPQKKFLYKKLIESGFELKMLYRKKTTHSLRK